MFNDAAVRVSAPAPAAGRLCYAHKYVHSRKAHNNVCYGSNIITRPNTQSAEIGAESRCSRAGVVAVKSQMCDDMAC